jgi:hypothetical protein
LDSMVNFHAGTEKRLAKQCGFGQGHLETRKGGKEEGESSLKNELELVRQREDNQIGWRKHGWLGEAQALDLQATPTP